MKIQVERFSMTSPRRSFDLGSKGPEPNNSHEDDEMRTLTVAEIDQVSGGIDSISIGPIGISGIEAGLALRNVTGALGVAFTVGYGLGTAINAGYTMVSGQSLGTDLYLASQS